MITAHFGITHIPFSQEVTQLTPAQQEVIDALKVHSYQRGFCLVAGDPGTGKSVIRRVFANQGKQQVTPQIGRTLHTYSNTIRILCEAMGITYDGGDLKCERQVIAEAYRLHQAGKCIALMIDDAHLFHLNHLRKLRLLFDEMPNNYAIVLFAETMILGQLALNINADLRSRISYSVLVRKLVADDIEAIILAECDRCGLPHNKIEPAALRLIAQSAGGILRHAANLTISSLIEAVRGQATTVATAHVNAALLQPHWRDADHWLKHKEK